MRPSTSRLLFALSPLSLGALVLAAGCDAEFDPAVEFRSAEGVLSLSLTDPVPGGGGCEGCVTCFKPSKGLTGNVCLRTDTYFTGSSVSVKDDVSLSFDDKDSRWQLYGSTVTPLCSGDFCDPTAITAIAPDQVELELNLQSTSTPQALRFISIGEDPWRQGPEIAVPDDLGEHPLEAADPVGSPAPPAVADAVTPAMAHITYPARSGGLHSCSGSLVAEDLVLTAAHCLVEPAANPKAKEIPGWPGWQRVPVAELHIRVGGLGSPDDPSFPEDSSHSAVAIHIHADRNVDLALIELAKPTGVTPLTLVDSPLVIKKGPLPTFAAYGYGVSGLPPGSGPKRYDWGRLKRTSLKEEFLVRKEFVDDEDLMTFAHPDGSIGVCHGDSGGPVIRVIAGVHQVVGVMLARVVDVDTGGVPKGDVPPEHAIQLLSGRGFAFSRHNRCGLGSPLAYVAARLDRAEVREWLAGFITPPLPPLPPFPPFEVPGPFPPKPPAPTF